MTSSATRSSPGRNSTVQWQTSGTRSAEQKKHYLSVTSSATRSLPGRNSVARWRTPGTRSKHYYSCDVINHETFARKKSWSAMANTWHIIYGTIETLCLCEVIQEKVVYCDTISVILHQLFTDVCDSIYGKHCTRSDKNVFFRRSWATNIVEPNQNLTRCRA